MSDVISFPLSKELVVITHNGVFHADDVVAVAILMGALYNPIKVARTRDPKVLEIADILVDVGGEYDPKRGRFDHHQKDFVETHPWTRIPYASAGLVWREFGRQYLRSNGGLLTNRQNEMVFDRIMNEFMIEIDALDNGVDFDARTGISAVISALNPVRGSSFKYDIAFDEAVKVAHMWLRSVTDSVIEQVIDYEAAEEVFNNGNDVAEFDRANTAWKKVASEMLRSGEQPPRLVVYPDPTGVWRVQTTPSDPDDIFSMSCPAPADWRGKRQFVIGDSVTVDFVHPNGFIGGAPNREAAVSLAQEWIRLSQAERQ